MVFLRQTQNCGKSRSWGTLQDKSPQGEQGSGRQASGDETIRHLRVILGHAKRKSTKLSTE